MKGMISIFLLTGALFAQSDTDIQQGNIADQQMIGVLSASYLYQSYLNIGLLADATAGGVYEIQEALAQCESLLTVIGGVRDEMLAYSKQIKSESDRLYVESLVKVADLLIQEGSALLRFYETNDETYAEEFMKFNELAQQAVSQLLGMEATE